MADQKVTSDLGPRGWAGEENGVCGSEVTGRGEWGPGGRGGEEVALVRVGWGSRG